MIESLQVSTKGDPAAAELVLPAGSDKVPGIVVIHEWWGINDDIRRLLGRFAAEGFAALAVDLYAGRSTTDVSEALQLSNDLRTPRAVEIISAATALLAGHPRGTGKVAVTGFCLGGAMALAAACNVDGLAAAVPFYGLGKDEYANGWRAKAPILGHFAKNDGFVSLDRARKIAQTVIENGGSFELCEYDAGHAFMREADPTAYHAPSAALAWDRTMTFLRQHLAG